MIGSPPWTHDEMRQRLEEFEGIYQQRPIKNNQGGMTSSHLFLFWFVLKKLQPKNVIESGVWKGLGTWLIEQACPDAELFCIDIDWSNLEYRSNEATYLSSDISLNDWSRLDKSKTLVFFDDHIDAIKRCRMCFEHGFKHLMFEDNYPPQRGDCYSLQEVFKNAGHWTNPRLRARLSRMFGRLKEKEVKPNTADAEYMREIAEVYSVLPPIFKLDKTRWGDVWDGRFPTPDPLLNTISKPWQQTYFDEAKWYTWICYVKLHV